MPNYADIMSAELMTMLTMLTPCQRIVNNYADTRFLRISSRNIFSCSFGAQVEFFFIKKVSKISSHCPFWGPTGVGIFWGYILRSSDLVAVLGVCHFFKFTPPRCAPLFKKIFAPPQQFFQLNFSRH